MGVKIMNKIDSNKNLLEIRLEGNGIDGHVLEEIENKMKMREGDKELLKVKKFEKTFKIEEEVERHVQKGLVNVLKDDLDAQKEGNFNLKKKL